MCQIDTSVFNVNLNRLIIYDTEQQHYCVQHLYVNGNYLFNIYYLEKHHVEM